MSSAEPRSPSTLELLEKLCSRARAARAHCPEESDAASQHALEAERMLEAAKVAYFAGDDQSAEKLLAWGGLRLAAAETAENRGRPLADGDREIAPASVWRSWRLTRATEAALRRPPRCVLARSHTAHARARRRRSARRRTRAPDPARPRPACARSCARKSSDRQPESGFSRTPPRGGCFE